MKKLKLDFNAKQIAKLGVFSALSFALTFFEFPIFPLVPYLKLDFSNVFVLIGGFSMGTIYGVIILVIKEALCLLKTTTVVGQLANLILGLCFTLVPFILYEYKRSFKRAVIGLIIGSILVSFISLLTNRFITFPLFMPKTFIEEFEKVWYLIILFNVIKAVLVSIITVIIYKRVKNLLNF